MSSCSHLKTNVRVFKGKIYYFFYQKLDVYQNCPHVHTCFCFVFFLCRDFCLILMSSTLCRSVPHLTTLQAQERHRLFGAQTAHFKSPSKCRPAITNKHLKGEGKKKTASIKYIELFFCFPLMKLKTAFLTGIRLVADTSYPSTLMLHRIQSAWIKTLFDPEEEPWKATSPQP